MSAELTLPLGQLHWVYLDLAAGSEQAGRRRAVAVSADEMLVGTTTIDRALRYILSLETAN
jgi:mRNA-degrading endonuclease toxin of MazEF toxin-antitoxin module